MNFKTPIYNKLSSWLSVWLHCAEVHRAADPQAASVWSGRSHRTSKLTSGNSECIQWQQLNILISRFQQTGKSLDEYVCDGHITLYWKIMKYNKVKIFTLQLKVPQNQGQLFSQKLFLGWIRTPILNLRCRLCQLVPS